MLPSHHIHIFEAVSSLQTLVISEYMTGFQISLEHLQSLQFFLGKNNKAQFEYNGSIDEHLPSPVMSKPVPAAPWDEVVCLH